MHNSSLTRISRRLNFTMMMNNDDSDVIEALKQFYKDNSSGKKKKKNKTPSSFRSRQTELGQEFSSHIESIKLNVQCKRKDIAISETKH